jgi:ribosomal protein L3 glutamine methyltransferase
MPTILNSTDPAIEDLVTLRDWLRYAVSRFNNAGIVYGHGTSGALDEAAFLVLRALDLPPDQLDPWLDARLTHAERAMLAALIKARVETRTPAPYLLNEAWIKGHKFYVDERVIIPRSYIGELLDQGLSAAVPDPEALGSVLDLCTGGGSLAILAALTFPDAAVDAVDISLDALAVARRNVVDYGLEDRIRLIDGDLFSALNDERYDLIISNPPYVDAEAVAAFPPEYKAEPVLAHAGGPDGLDLVRRILAGAANHLTPEGVIVVEIGHGRANLERDYPHLPFLWLDTDESEGEVFALMARDLAPAPQKARNRKGKSS